MKTDRTDFLERIEAKRSLVEKGLFIMSDSGGPVVTKTSPTPPTSLDDLHRRLNALLQ
jgi:hypothetical protein